MVAPGIAHLHICTFRIRISKHSQTCDSKEVQPLSTAADKVSHRGLIPPYLIHIRILLI